MNDFIRYIIRFLIVLGALSLGTWIAYQVTGNQLLGFDDAHIFLVYGKNLASGFGPAYNVGEAWVEGFTSPLWMVLIAASYLVTRSPELLLLALSLVLVSTAIARLWLHIDSEYSSPLYGLILLVWALGSPYFVVWNSISLMDTALWTAVLVWAVVLAIDINSNRLFLAAIMPIMLLTRPEAIVWGAVLILLGGLLSALKFGRTRAWWHIRPALLAYLATLAFMTIVRLIIYGYPLPNTYYAKLPPSATLNIYHGLLYLAGFLVTNWPVIIILCITIAALILNLPWLINRLRSSEKQLEDPPRVRLVSVTIITLTALIIPVLEGGDTFHGARFYQSAWPLLVLPLIAFMDSFGPTRSRVAILGVLLFLLISSLTLVNTTWINGGYRASANTEMRVAQRGELTGNILNALLITARPSIGVVAAGGVALAYDGQVIDLVGLNNSEMAHLSLDREGPKGHSGFDPEIFFEQQPELVLPLGGDDSSRVSFWLIKYGWHNSVMKGSLDTKPFRGEYQLAVLKSPTMNMQVITFVERDFLDTLAGRGIEVELMLDSTSVDE